MPPAMPRLAIALCALLLTAAAHLAAASHPDTIAEFIVQSNTSLSTKLIVRSFAQTFLAGSQGDQGGRRLNASNAPNQHSKTAFKLGSPAPLVVSSDLLMGPVHAPETLKAALVTMTRAHASLMKTMPGVTAVEENSPVFLQASTVTSAFPTSSWGLDRIDQAFGFDGFYTAAGSAASKIDIYVIDTGVQASTPDLLGRVAAGTSIIMPNSLGNTDCEGHGTFCASLAAGTTLGVAKAATIVPVQALDCSGSGTVYGVMQGLAWVRSAALVAARSGRRGIVSMSLSAPANSLMDQAVEFTIEAGIPVVVAAGNYATTACNFSPSRGPNVISVGGTSSDDSMLSYSNYGGCVDLFAPGDTITGADLTGGTKTLSGTSMATPFVAGTLALLLEANSSMTPSDAKSKLLATAVALTPPCDLDCVGYISPNVFLQTPSASMRSVPATLPLNGLVLNDDFPYWLPELSLSDSGGQVCVQFDVKALGSTAASADIKVALGSDWFPTLAGFSSAAPQCIQNEWYYIFTANALSSSLSGSNPGLKVTGLSSKPSSTTTFYVLATSSATGVGLEMGTGAYGSVQQTTLLRGVDSSRNQTNLRTLAFSTGSSFNLTVSNIASCSGFNSLQFQTPSFVQPTALPTRFSINSSVLVPSSFVFVPGTAASNTFKQYAASWIYPQSQGGACFEFQISGNQGALAALTSAPLPFPALGPLPAGLTAIVFQLGVASTSKRLQSFAARKNNVVIQAVSTTQTLGLTSTFKVSVRAGQASLYRRIGNTAWTKLLGFPNTDTALQYLSLSGTGASTVIFQNISMC